MNARPWKLLFSAGCAVLLGASCAPKKTVKKSSASALDAESAEAGVTGVPEVDVEEARIHGKEFQPVKDLAAIRFDFDSYILGESARAALKANSEYLKLNPDMEILVEGHCDERGTIEYNIALGQKRAKEVRDYYIRLGIPGRSVGTLSFGEERPVCDKPDDECWASNRRAETKIRSRTVNGKTNPR